MSGASPLLAVNGPPFMKISGFATVVAFGTDVFHYETLNIGGKGDMYWQFRIYQVSMKLNFKVKL